MIWFRSSESAVGVFECVLRKSIRCGVLVLLGAALNLCGIARAQQALISAVSIDHSLTLPTNDTVNLAPDRAFLGPLQLSLGLRAGAQYNDNINTSETGRESDTILTGGLTVDLFWPATVNSTLHFGTDLGYIEYVQHPANNGLEISPDSALFWEIKFEDATLTLFDQISYLQEGTQDSALANVVTLPRLDNTVGGRVSWDPNQWLLEGGYSYDYFISPSTLFNYVDRESHYFFTRDAWCVNETNQVGLEASLSLTRYLTSSLGSTRSLSVGPYAQWQLTPAMFATARFGEVVSYFDSTGPQSPASSMNSYYFGVNITDTPADFLTAAIDVTRQTALGLNQGSDYIEQIAATGTFSLTITPRISLDGYVTYQNGNQPLQNTVLVAYVIGAPNIFAQQTLNENFQFYGGGPTLTWHLTDKLSTHLNYSWWRRLSNLPDRGFRQDTVSLNIDYTFW
jgi:hypothetical protein